MACAALCALAPGKLPLRCPALASYEARPLDARGEASALTRSRSFAPAATRAMGLTPRNADDCRVCRGTGAPARREASPSCAHRRRLQASYCASGATAAALIEPCNSTAWSVASALRSSSRERASERAATGSSSARDKLRARPPKPSYGGRRLKNSSAVQHNMGRSDVFGYVLLALLALQYGLQPFLTSRFLSKAGCDARAVVLVTELAKAALCACSLLLQRSPAGDTRRPAARDVLQTAAPAACYLVQNLALQQAYADLDSLTFNCLNQTKLAATAFFLYVLLRQRQSAQQLVALAMLLSAGLLLQLTGEQRAASSAGSAVKSFRRGVAVSAVRALRFASGLR